MKKRVNLSNANHAKTSCNTRSIIVQFRVTPKQWKLILRKAVDEDGLAVDTYETWNRKEGDKP